MEPSQACVIWVKGKADPRYTCTPLELVSLFFRIFVEGSGPSEQNVNSATTLHLPMGRRMGSVVLGVSSHSTSLLTHMLEVYRSV
jgi:hypothetical protein